MKKSISINLQGLVFHIEEDGYEQLRRYLAEVKAHFAAYPGHDEIVADIEGRIAELFAARLTPTNQVITVEDVAAVTAQLGRVADFDLPEDEDAPAGTATPGAGPTAGAYSRTAYEQGPAAEPTGPRQLFRDVTNKKIAGVAAGLAHYFGTNPLWIRLIFVGFVLLNNFYEDVTPWHDRIDLAGISVIGYLLLWLLLPKREGLAPPEGSELRGLGARKLYRDTDNGSMGGVSAGLAHYFRIDVTIIRVAFIAVTVLGGSGILIYLILWIVVPEARTVSEKLEMRGEDVTLSNIDQNLRSDGFASTGRARVVQENLQSVGSTIAPIFRFIFTVIGWFAGVVMLIISLALLVAVGAVLGVVLGAFPEADWVHTGDVPVALLRATLPTWGLVCGFVVFLIPTLSLLLAAVRLFVKRQLLPVGARLTFFGIWLVALFGLIGSFAQLKRDFRDRGEIQTTQTFNLTTPVVVLDTQDDDTNLRVYDVRVAGADSGQAATLFCRVTARGATEAAARRAAAQVEYSARLIQDSILTLPRDFRFKAGAPWREQRPHLTLRLPADRRYRLTERFTNMLDEDVYDDRYSRDNLNDKRLFTVRGGHFVLVSGPETTISQEHDDDYDEQKDHSFRIEDEDGDVVLRFPDRMDRDFKIASPRAGAPSRVFSETGFQRIDIGGGYQARIHQGSTFRVVARGDQDDLDQVRVHRNGDVLEIESKGQFRWYNWNRDRHHQIVFDIEMPTLAGLNLSGASRANVSGFRSGGDLRIDQTGASVLRVTDLNRPVQLNSSGASRAMLVGNCPDFFAELSGASDLMARDLKATKAQLNTSGASRAHLMVVRELRAEASGASHVTYYGSPEETDVNSSGAASIRHAGSRSADENTPDEDNSDDDTNDDNNEDDQQDDASATRL